MRPARTLPAIAAAACAVAIAGCGLGPGKGTPQVSLTVTRGFGNARVASVADAKVPGSETVMRMLERSFSVTTRYGGGFVQSINGLAGDASRRDWFYYVNGIQAPAGAAATTVHRGDRIWWDLHDWTATETIPAVVGSFPEPFVHGVAGKRLPTAVECASEVTAACQKVSSELGDAGVPVASQLLGTGSGQDSLAVDVAPWRDLKTALVAALIQHGPSTSGVYARFNSAGTELELLDPAGHVVRTLGAGAGLIAATADRSSVPTWLVTGTDRAGVTNAAAALSAGRLRDHFAVAVQGNAVYPLPLDGSS
jgi:Domain of unknown function (DUF4430)